MSPEQQQNNLASWAAVAADIEQYPDTTHWEPWKILARRFLQESELAGFSRYFRAGQSMHHILISTLNHHGLRHEPRVTIEFHPPLELRIAYGNTNLSFHPPEEDYALPFDDSFAALRRLLSRLWTATTSEPTPTGIVEGEC